MAQRQIDNYKDFSEAVMKVYGEFEEKYNQLKAMFESNMVGQGHRDALLNHQIKTYLDCLEKRDK